MKRLIYCLLLNVILLGLIRIINVPFSGLPALWPLLAPATGWVNQIETADQWIDYPQQLPITAPAHVLVDSNDAIHLYSTNEDDIFFIQGYTHAQLRLWQMDIQFRATVGSLAEILGQKFLSFDIAQRRKGLSHAARENTAMLQTHPQAWRIIDAYTRGVNAYIQQLRKPQLPIEFKLLGYQPEPWSHYKTMVVIKSMANELTSQSWDVQFTLLRKALGEELFSSLYPERLSVSRPVINEYTNNAPAFATFESQLNADLQLPINNYTTDTTQTKGSNSWVVNAQRTKDSSTILANDPHLKLGLPSLWLEMHLQSTNLNVYGASLIGVPGIVIGFNDHIAWGLTNNYRDVIDHYLIQPIDPKHYLWEGKAKAYKYILDTIKIKNAESFVLTTQYTLHGPLTYDSTNPVIKGLNTPIAVSWTALHAGLELYSIYLLNKAQSIDKVPDALEHFICPSQNITLMDRQGQIGIYAPGRIPIKPKGMGKFVMRGDTSATLWTRFLTLEEQPQSWHPTNGYIVAANQITTNEQYPYWLYGNFSDPRAIMIDSLLSKDTINQGHIHYHQQLIMNNESDLLNQLNHLLQVHCKSPLYQPKTTSPATLDADNEDAALLWICWHYVQDLLWQEVSLKSLPMVLPNPYITLQLLKTDSFYHWQHPAFHNKRSKQILTQAFQLAQDSLNRIAHETKTWSQFKNFRIKHLAQIDAFSSPLLNVGGEGHVINALKSTAGPSWRMVVKFKGSHTEAYTHYPGGASGNPFSLHYQNQIESWTTGHLHTVIFEDVKHIPKAVIRKQFKIDPYAQP